MALKFLNTSIFKGNSASSNNSSNANSNLNSNSANTNANTNANINTNNNTANAAGNANMNFNNETAATNINTANEGKNRSADYRASAFFTSFGTGVSGSPTTSLNAPSTSFFSPSTATSTPGNSLNFSIFDSNQSSGAVISPELNRILYVQNMFIGGQDLTLGNRRFILEGVLTKICRRASIPKKFFLFDDILVYGQMTLKSKLTKQNILEIASIRVENINDERGLKNAFRILSPQKSFIVTAESPEKKNLWLEAIKQQILLAESSDQSQKAALHPATYIVAACMNCGSAFTAFNRRHACRNCEKVVCGTCSENKIVLPAISKTKPLRVCITCYGSELSSQKQSSTTRKIAWLCDSDSDSDIDDFEAFSATDDKFERFHRSYRIHGI